jgi:hypothetical protein
LPVRELPDGGLVKRAWLVPLVAAACARAEPPPSGPCVERPAGAMDLGFDTPFSLRVRPACGAGPVSWTQVAGPPVALAVTAGGLSAAGRTPALGVALGAPPPWGVIPFSPRTRGELAFVARWRAPGGGERSEEVRLAAAARSRGLPNVPVGARVHLGGAGWRLDAAPPGSAVREVSGGFVPDVSGGWRLADGGGRALLLRSGRYDETPLDCGRSGCHAAISAASAESPMTTTLARGLGEARRPAGYPGCAVGCHATGEPQVHDGGFWHVASELELEVDTARLGGWEEVPRLLRRLGGAGCLACHGPGAVPEESARWSILRADVCATCHDAPPRYGHAEAWRRTRMARADRDPRTREVGCARCHTTAGFLASAGALHGDRRTPAAAGASGIGCAACHAVHAPGVKAEPGLLRAVAAPAGLGELPAAARKSAACVRCHAPGEEAAPASSAAAIWLGRGGLDPRSARPIAGPAPHGMAPGGCLSCHRAGPPELARGAGHAFAATTTACAPCHGPRPADADLRARAARLWERLGRGRAGVPPHASAPPLDRGTVEGRAAWNVLLVLEDPAAAVHNPQYARRLLDAAEEALR